MTSGSIQSLLVRTMALYAVWLVLTLSLDPFYLGLGLTTALVVSWLSLKGSSRSGLRWSGLVVYVPWLLWQVLVSGAHVAYLILHPRLPIDPKLVRRPTSLEDPSAVVIFGNSITLTPGTITAEVNPHELVIHAMDDASAAGLEDMERKIAAVFGLTRQRSDR